MTRENGKLDEVWAYISEDPDGREWLCGPIVKGKPMLLVAGDRQTLERWRSQATDWGPVPVPFSMKLVRFSKREDVDS